MYSLYMLQHGMYIQRVHRDVVVNLPVIVHYSVVRFYDFIR